MTIWTDRKHKQAVDAIESLREDPMLGIVFPGLVTAFEQALDEIARLRAESARRMVWLETAQRALEHANAALMDMTEKAAKPEVNDEMVGRAHAAVVEHLSANAGCVYAEDEGPDMLRTALEAALNPKENEA